MITVPSIDSTISKQARRRIIMSTRGVIGFQIDNCIKATYKHSDCYPKGLGKEVVTFLCNRSIKDLQKFKENVQKIRWVIEEEKPSKEDIKRYKRFSDLSVNTRKLDDWYCLLRKTQGTCALSYILSNKLKVLIDSTDFLKDSLFCEWGYIINFDECTLDTYKGFQRKPDKNNPLGFVPSEIYSGTKYYPCKRIHRANFFDLEVNKWLKAVNQYDK